MRLVEDDLSCRRVQALIELHVKEARGNSPPGQSFALDIEGLRTPDMTFWSAWEGDDLMGCCALKQLSPTHGELKSMRTSPDHLRKGVGRGLLDHVVSVARSRGYARLSLETGALLGYAAAISLYHHYGFVKGETFAGYENSDFNQCFHLDL